MVFDSIISTINFKAKSSYEWTNFDLLRRDQRRERRSLFRLSIFRVLEEKRERGRNKTGSEFPGRKLAGEVGILDFNYPMRDRLLRSYMRNVSNNIMLGPGEKVEEREGVTKKGEEK